MSECLKGIVGSDPMSSRPFASFFEHGPVNHPLLRDGDGLFNESGPVDQRTERPSIS